MNMFVFKYYNTIGPCYLHWHICSKPEKSSHVSVLGALMLSLDLYAVFLLNFEIVLPVWTFFYGTEIVSSNLGRIELLNNYAIGVCAS